jgi:NAD(P)-dependent dehydrogenase (short-subunit alcohol dehydrogenase family)
MALDGKRVLVTGAGKGIGRATALMAAARGARVVALSRSAEDLAGLRGSIGCETVACDLADLAAARAAAERVLPIDHLVNNAGTTVLEPFLDSTLDGFDQLMAVNTKAPMVLAQVVARDMIARGHKGAIVNVSSNAAFIGIAGHAAYCASKAALDALTRVMAVELGRHGIRVNSVNPTVTLTPMAVKAWSDPAKAGPMLQRVPLGRFVEPEEVAEVILFLLEPRAAMVHGHSLLVDGGFLAN